MTAMRAETDVDRTLRARIDVLSKKKGGRTLLAEACGVSVQSISNIVSGVHRPKLPLLVAIADYYGVTVDWLLGREGCKEKTAAAQYAEAMVKLPDHFLIGAFLGAEDIGCTALSPQRIIDITHNADLYPLQLFLHRRRQYVLVLLLVVLEQSNMLLRD